jgi:SAM-dependent methyltransferase
MTEIVCNYGDVPLHRSIGDLIRRHSENKEDIRNLLRPLIRWERVHSILDLGCGYGWFEETLTGVFDLVHGIDCLAENGPAFLAVAGRLARKAVFERAHLPSTVDSPPRSFDLIVSAYSLYFFPGIMPEVRRLLDPEGFLLIVTHSASMLVEGEKHFDFKNLRKIINNFSAENGEAILRRWFSRVEWVDYTNSLVFTEDDAEDLARYIDFKKEFIARDAPPLAVRENLLGELKREGSLRFNKNDRIFLAQE